MFNCCSVRRDARRKFYLSPWKLKLLEYIGDINKKYSKIGSKKKKKKQSQSLSRGRERPLQWRKYSTRATHFIEKKGGR